MLFVSQDKEDAVVERIPSLGVGGALAPPQAAKLLSIAYQVALSPYTDPNRGLFTSKSEDMSPGSQNIGRRRMW